MNIDEGPPTLLTPVRQMYWIIGVRQLVKQETASNVGKGV